MLVDVCFPAIKTNVVVFVHPNNKPIYKELFILIDQNEQKLSTNLFCSIKTEIAC